MRIQKRAIIPVALGLGLIFFGSLSLYGNPVPGQTQSARNAPAQTMVMAAVDPDRGMRPVFVHMPAPDTPVKDLKDDPSMAIGVQY